MNFLQGLVVPAVVSDCVSRFLSYVSDKNFNHENVEEKLERMEQLLLKIHTAVEEAESRRITNRRLLQWLKKMMESMYEGYYVFETFKYQQALTEEAKDFSSEVSNSSAISLFNPTKRIRIASDSARKLVFGDEQIKELSDVLKRLEKYGMDLAEFNALIMGSCPTLPRRPYDSYLYIDNCIMFGRHVERERIMNFLLQPEPPGASHWGVLPIVGPYRIGKTTLVEHVCNDERVRDEFSLIVTTHGMDVRSGHSETLTTLRDCGHVVHQKSTSGRTLLIIEDIWDEHVPILRRILFSSLRCLPSGSKFILTSRSQGILSLGTVEPIRIQKLPKEEYWYFFKTRVFGSMDPEEHPRLALVARNLAMELEGALLAVKVGGWLLRSNPNAQFWQAVSTGIKQLKPEFRWYNSDSTITSLTLAPEYESRCHVSRDATHNHDLPLFPIVDITNTRTISPGRRFEIELWKSPVAPYNAYTIVCEREEHKLSSIDSTSNGGADAVNEPSSSTQINPSS